MNPAWVSALVLITTTACGAVLFIGRWVWKIGRRVSRFLDDFFGDPAHDGLPSTPGVMARLVKLEQSNIDIKAQVIPNGGHSLRDTVDTIQRELREHVDQTNGGNK